ncbi:hypothetical protein A33K_18523 [Burkholderia humptydooensis MSMB43]|uniref:Uncharacterized protein n=1 Tax=Burkholderia humptydooensis MSMB43 TaxID=441157 RepID=A0ABN0FYC5_9BURK|nr:hypothetical protein A33K_18523 [Burkholderia humptydooensis MSMB43]
MIGAAAPRPERGPASRARPPFAQTPICICASGPASSPTSGYADVSVPGDRALF